MVYMQEQQALHYTDLDGLWTADLVVFKLLLRFT